MNSGRLTAICRLLLLAAALVLALGVPASASAGIVTVGAPLTGFHLDAAECLATDCTFANLELHEPGAPPRAPVSGAIVRWRVEGASSKPGYEIRALTAGSGSSFTSTASSAEVTPKGEGVDTFVADVPIVAGQYIGLEVPALGSVYYEPTVGRYAYAGSSSPLVEGQSTTFATAPGEFAFNADILPPPRLTGVSPAAGPVAGGTEVTIAGSNLLEVKSVTFGGVPTTSYTVDSEGTITAVAPPNPSAGPVDIAVTTAAGTTPQGTDDVFTYLAPSASAGSSPPPESPAPACRVPKLVGKKLKVSKKALTAADCRLGAVRKRNGVRAKAGRVVKQSRDPRLDLPAGAKVAVTLGR